MNEENIVAVKVDLVWKEYLKGVREYNEEQNVVAELIAPFYVGVVDVVDEKISYRYFCKISSMD